MNKLILPAAAALALSFGAASAQDVETHTTTVQSSPEDGSQTTTTTTERSDAYGNYRKTVTSTQRFSAGAFEAPAGYTYERYSVGEHVPHVLVASPDLVLSDYATYRLDEPPRGLEWIRVGNDALLVDRSTGEVIQSDYDLFE
jgi:Ni/Co efflux regulator RcnB